MSSKTDKRGLLPGWGGFGADLERIGAVKEKLDNKTILYYEYQAYGTFFFVMCHVGEGGQFQLFVQPNHYTKYSH